MALRQKLSIAVALVCLLLACLPLEAVFSEQLTQMLKITLTVYALARGLNAVISVAQGTEMSIEPMGVGLTLTPGEVLDPLNDLIEQVSTVLLIASASIGVQKIILMLTDHALIQILLVLLAVMALLLSTLRPAVGNSGRVVLKMLVILTVLRFTVPMLAVVSHQTQNWLQTERQQAVAVLESAQSSVDQLNESYQSESGGWLSHLRDRFDLQTQLSQVKSRAEQGVEAAVYLLAEFVLIMVLLPLLFVWLALRIANTIHWQ